MAGSKKSKSLGSVIEYNWTDPVEPAQRLRGDFPSQYVALEILEEDSEAHTILARVFSASPLDFVVWADVHKFHATHTDTRVRVVWTDLGLPGRWRYL